MGLKSAVSSEQPGALCRVGLCSRVLFSRETPAFTFLWLDCWEKSLSQSGCSCSSSALHHHLPGKLLKFKFDHFNSLEIFSVDFLPMNRSVPGLSEAWPGLIEGDFY